MKNESISAEIYGWVIEDLFLLNCCCWCISLTAMRVCFTILLPDSEWGLIGLCIWILVSCFMLLVGKSVFEACCFRS